MSLRDFDMEIQRLESCEENVRRALSRTTTHALKESLALELAQIQAEIKTVLRARRLAVQVRKTCEKEWRPLTPTYMRPAR